MDYKTLDACLCFRPEVSCDDESALNALNVVNAVYLNSS